MDEDDYTIFGEHYNSKQGDDRYDHVYDLDRDGVIDRVDYTEWRSRWRRGESV